MKNQINRAIAVILSIFLFVSLTACQTPAEPTEPPPPTQSSETTASSGSSQLAESPANSGAESPEPGDDAGEISSGSQLQASPQGNSAVARVIVELNSTEVLKGTILDPNVIIMPADAIDKTYTLSSSDERVIRQVYGFWTASGGGSAQLVATASNGVMGAVTVTVIVPLEAVSLSASEITLNRGDSVTLTPSFLPDDTTDTRTQYTSGNEEIVSVSADGTLLAVNAGTTEIQCSAGDVSATCTVTVIVPVTGISMNTDRRIYSAGGSGSFTVQISPEDATDTTFSAEISNSAVTLTGTNGFYCNASGEATITVTAANGMTAEQTITVIDLVAFANEVFRLTNTERVNAGLEPLSMMSSLTQTAVVRANEIIQSFSHTRPDGRDCFTAFSENNVTYIRAGENIAMGQRTPSEVVRAWMDSAGHRENIMNDEFGHLGVGVALDNSGRLYWSQNFTD